MRFNIAMADSRVAKEAQHLRCPECALPFWSASQPNGKIRVGIEPTCSVVHREEEVYL
jgi:hypothetical protein